MKRKKVAIFITVILVLFGGLGIYYFTPKNINLNLSPPNNRDSNITIKLNGDIVFSKYYQLNDSSSMPAHGHEWIKVTINHFKFSIEVNESEMNLDLDGEFNILFGDHIEIDIWSSMSMRQNWVRP